MTTAIKQRIVGAIFILSLGVILIPLILDKPQAGQEQEQEMLSHVIPDAPAMPDVSEVSKIHYVFNDNLPEPTVPVEPAPTPEPEAPAPVLLPTDLATTPVVSVPLPPMMAQSEATNPLPDEASQTEPAPAVSKSHTQASASLAEASQAQWTIQLGAFSSEKNANALVSKLASGGFNAYLRQMTQDTLVRVYVSPGVSKEQAVDLASKLDTEYGLKGIVVRYFQN